MVTPVNETGYSFNLFLRMNWLLRNLQICLENSFFAFISEVVEIRTHLWQLNFGLSYYHVLLELLNSIQDNEQKPTKKH